MVRAIRNPFFAAVLSLLFSLSFEPSWAHCDTYDGPVVKDAQKAFETGKVDLVLVWVTKADEADIRRAFAEAQTVRKLGPQAKQLADNYFFETLVRIHRAGEGAPYTGLKPAGKIDPAIGMADEALAAGSVSKLSKEMTNHLQKALNEKFQHAVNTKKHAAHNVEAGREHVHAYVEYVHFVEGVHNAIAGNSAVQDGPAAPPEKMPHAH